MCPCISEQHHGYGLPCRYLLVGAVQAPGRVSVAGATVYTLRLVGRADCVDTFRLHQMAPSVNTEDLVDAHEVAEILRLSHPNSVSTYQRRYADMPKPVIDLGPGRPRLWLRSEMVTWAMRTGRLG